MKSQKFRAFKSKAMKMLKNKQIIILFLLFLCLLSSLYLYFNSSQKSRFLNSFIDAEDYRIEADNKVYKGDTQVGVVQENADLEVKGGANVEINGKHTFNNILIEGSNDSKTRVSTISQTATISNPAYEYDGYLNKAVLRQSDDPQLTETLTVIDGYLRLIRKADYFTYDESTSSTDDRPDGMHLCQGTTKTHDCFLQNSAEDTASFRFYLKFTNHSSVPHSSTDPIYLMGVNVNGENQTICDSGKLTFSQHRDACTDDVDGGDNQVTDGVILYQTSLKIPGNILPRGGELIIPFTLVTLGQHNVELDFVERTGNFFAPTRQYGLKELNIGESKKIKAYSNNGSVVPSATISANAVAKFKEMQSFYKIANPDLANPEQMGTSSLSTLASALMKSDILHVGFITRQWKITDTNYFKDINLKYEASPHLKMSDEGDYKFSSMSLGEYPSDRTNLNANTELLKNIPLIYQSDIPLYSLPTILIANKIILNGGKIDVSGKGHNGSSWDSDSGFGPGGGMLIKNGLECNNPDDEGGGGGGFGGFGGRQHNWTLFNNTRINPDASRGTIYNVPTLPQNYDFSEIIGDQATFADKAIMRGSGGGGAKHVYCSPGKSENKFVGGTGGGGIILITKETVDPESNSIVMTINENFLIPKILANGDMGGSYAGSGSGGFISISTGKIVFGNGVGSISARGAVASTPDGYGSPGGGGRIYISGQIKNASNKNIFNVEDYDGCKDLTAKSNNYCIGGYNSILDSGNFGYLSDGSLTSHDIVNITEQTEIGSEDDLNIIRIVATRGRLPLLDGQASTKKDKNGFIAENIWPNDQQESRRNTPGTVSITNNPKDGVIDPNPNPPVSIIKTSSPSPIIATDITQEITFTLKVTLANPPQNNTKVLVEDEFTGKDAFTGFTGFTHDPDRGIKYDDKVTEKFTWNVDFSPGKNPPDQEKIITYKATLRPLDQIKQYCGQGINSATATLDGVKSQSSLTLTCKSSITGNVYGSTITIPGLTIGSSSVLISAGNAIRVDTSQGTPTEYKSNEISWSEKGGLLTTIADARTKHAKTITAGFEGGSWFLDSASSSDISNISNANNPEGGLWNAKVGATDTGQSKTYSQRGTIILPNDNFTISRNLTAFDPTDSMLGFATDSDKSINIEGNSTSLLNLKLALLAPDAIVNINTNGGNINFKGLIIAKKININLGSGNIFIEYDSSLQNKPLPLFSQAMKLIQ